MSNQCPVSDLIPAYVFGLLGTEENAQVYAHLSECEFCQTEVETYQTLLLTLTYQTAEHPPPPHLGPELMKRITIAAPPKAHRSGWAWLNWLHNPVPAWSFLLLVILLLLSNWIWTTSVPSAPSGATMTSLAMLSPDPASDAQGVLIISSDGDEGALVVEHLPPLPGPQHYHLWLIDSTGQNRQGIAFEVDADGYAAIILKSDVPLTTYRTFEISIEPQNNPVQRTGSTILRGDFKQ